MTIAETCNLTNYQQHQGLKHQIQDLYCCHLMQEIQFHRVLAKAGAKIQVWFAIYIYIIFIIFFPLNFGGIILISRRRLTTTYFNRKAIRLTKACMDWEIYTRTFQNRVRYLHGKIEGTEKTKGLSQATSTAAAAAVYPPYILTYGPG